MDAWHAKNVETHPVSADTREWGGKDHRAWKAGGEGKAGREEALEHKSPRLSGVWWPAAHIFA